LAHAASGASSFLSAKAIEARAQNVDRLRRAWIRALAPW